MAQFAADIARNDSWPWDGYGPWNDGPGDGGDAARYDTGSGASSRSEVNDALVERRCAHGPDGRLVDRRRCGHCCCRLRASPTSARPMNGGSQSPEQPLRPGAGRRASYMSPLPVT